MTGIHLGIYQPLRGMSNMMEGALSRPASGTAVDGAAFCCAAIATGPPATYET